MDEAPRRRWNLRRLNRGRGRMVRRPEPSIQQFPRESYVLRRNWLQYSRCLATALVEPVFMR